MAITCKPYSTLRHRELDALLRKTGCLLQQVNCILPG
jgi:hypothetical protein